MKTRYFLSMLLGLLLATWPVAAQTNRLYIPDMASLADETITVPVFVENESQFVALQFTLQVPEGVSFDPQSATLTERKADHTVTFRQLADNSYMCLIYSPSNTPFKGGEGQLMSVDMNVPANYLEGSVHEFSFSDAVLSQRDGTNILSEATCGKLTIQYRPDLKVSDVALTETSVNPEGSLNVSWQVTNLGSITTQKGWTERISLVQDNNSLLLGTTYYESGIAGGAVVSRQATLTLPSLPGIDGSAKVKVEIVPQRELDDSEATRENNIGVSTSTVTVGRRLILSLPVSNVTEDYKDPIRCTLSRSGNRTESQLFTISSTEDSRVDVPVSVVIPSGQSAVNFYIQLTDNQVPDANEYIDITVSGNDYEPVTGRLNIEDNEYPDLTVTASSQDITEGQTFQLTITTSRVKNEAVEVTINSENTSRFTFPSKVTIPAGESSVVVNVTAKDDDTPDMDISNAFTVYASRHNKGEVVVILSDDDMPDIELILTPNEISEGAGPQSVIATVRKTNNIDKRITIKFSDDAPSDALFYTTKTLDIQAGVAEMSFTMGPVDNARVEGERTYTITAAAYVSSCSCVVGSTSGNRGVVQAQLTVLDDDGEALSLSSSTNVVKEGEAITLTIGRNTEDLSSDVLVTLSSNYDDNLLYDKNVTIPAGSSTVDVVVTSQRNNIDNDSRTVTFAATADGFIKATYWFMVTDQSLPDAIIRDVVISGNNVYAGEKVGISLVVENIGFAPLSAPVRVNLYSGLSSKPVATLYCNDDIADGDSYTFRGSFQAPTSIRNTYIYAVVNESQAQAELIATNNTSQHIALNIISPYTATVQTDATIYEPGATVTITGQLTPAAQQTVSGQEVEVYVINNGTRQVLSATTDEQGAFSTVFTPLAEQTGHFTVGACYPDAGLSEEIAGFDIFGLKRANYNSITVECAVGDPYTLNIPLLNPCSQSLSGLTASVVSAPDDCDITFTLPSTIEAGKQATMQAVITGTAPSEELKWYNITINVQTAEGASLNIPVYYYCASQKPNLVVVGGSEVSLTLPDGLVTEYGVTITNQGKGESGPIVLSIPSVDWLDVATPVRMASLAQNDSATIIFRMNPTDILQLNIDAYATVGINSENGSSTYVRLNVVPVATSTGNLHVVVGDDFTYDTEVAPYVSGASVTVKNPTTGEIVASGTTDENGVFDAEMLAGYYTLTISAEKHDTYSSTIFIEASRTNHEDIYLPYQSITVDWSVEETEIEDEYRIVTTVQYETNFPNAQLIWTFPEKVPEENHILYVACTNKGRLPAYDINLVLPESNDRLEFTPLDVVHCDTLKPESSLVFPVQVTVVRQNSSGNGNSGSGSGGDSGNGSGSDGDDSGENAGGSGGGSGSGSSGTGSSGTGSSGTGSSGTGSSGTGGSGTGGNPGGGSGITLPGEAPCITFYYPFRVTYHYCVCINGKWVPQERYEYRVYTRQEGNCSNKSGGYVGTGSGGGIGGPGGGGGGWYSGGSGGGSASTSVRNCNPCEVNVLHRLVECGGQWIPYYECAKDAYLAYKSNGNYGKTAVCIIKETIPGMSCAAGGVECMYHSFSQGYLTDDQMDNCVDALIGDCVGELVPTVSWLWKVKKCWDIFNQPCNSQIDGDNWLNSEVKQFQNLRRAAAVGAAIPSYMTSFYENTVPMINAANAIHTIFVDRYGDEEWTQSSAEQIKLLYYSELDQPQDATIDELYNALLQYRPDNISLPLFNRYIERLYNSRKIARGESVTSDNHRNHELWVAAFDTIAQAHAFAVDKGYDNIGTLYEKECTTFIKKVEEASDAVCATITLSFNQKMTMTRQAFRGTLTVTNGNESNAMEEVRLNLEVKDSEGNVATSHEFQMNVESLNGFEGNKNFEDGWTLDANGKGTATILFIPTKYAAPTEPVDYSFGGTLTYIDPYTGLEVTRTLNPVTLTVKPSPNLDLTYFMQRDVYGDDPLTDEVEPKEEAEFALLINNIGNGDATNVRILTSQPEIVDNQKGALINFEIVSSQLNGGDKTLALNSSVMNDFGNIPAHTTAYAQWWLTCDVLGHFVNYDVEATHVTSYDNPDLTLLNDVTIHELIRSIKVGDGSALGFMVNDLADAEDLPDMLYFTDGTTAEVGIATNAVVERQNNTDYLLTITSSFNGWNYRYITDPTEGKAKLISIRRQSDGKEINLRNFWQTDRTLRDARVWLYENNLHFVDEMPDGTETYILTFEPRPDVELEVVSVDGVPDENTVLRETVNEVTVTFSKPIIPETFTREDITLVCQGATVEAPIEIISVSDTLYKLNLSEATLEDGYYILTIQTATITDNENFLGADGKAVSWIQFPSLQTPRITVEDTHTLVSSSAVSNQWYKDGKPVSGATNQRFTPVEDGVYHVAVTNGIYSSEPSNSYRVTFLNTIDLSLNLAEGWNWISVNIADFQDPALVLTPIAAADQLISLTQGLQKDAALGWTGNLVSLSPAEGYKLHTTEKGNFTWQNPPVDAESINIPLYQGWNWVGYTTAVEKDVNEALAGLQPSEDDVVKGFDAFAIYNEGKWEGTLKTLSPGEGYLFQVAQSHTFTYPYVKVLVEEIVAEVKEQPVISETVMPWYVASHSYPDNMTMIAEIFADNERVDDGQLVVGAFVGNECRGIGKYEAGKVFITIHGNAISGDMICFKAFDPTQMKEITIQENCAFGNVMMGSIKRPVSLHLGNPTSVDGVSADFGIYPNPVRQRLFINGLTDEIQEISVLASTGAVVLNSHGYPAAGLDVTSLSSGLYVIVISTSNGDISLKFMKQN